MSGIKEKISNTIEKLTPGHHKHTAADQSTLDHTGNLSSPVNPVVGKHTSTTDYGTQTGPLSSACKEYGTASAMGATTGPTAHTPTVGSAANYGSTTGLAHGAHGTGLGHTTTASTGGTCIPEKEIIDSKTFTKTVDEEVLIEKKKFELEHRPRQEEYVVETRKVGEKRIPGAATEVVGTDAREVEHREGAAPRGDRTVIVEGVDVPASEVREFDTHTAKHPMTHQHSTAGKTCYDNSTGKQL